MDTARTVFYNPQLITPQAIYTELYGRAPTPQQLQDITHPRIPRALLFRPLAPPTTGTILNTIAETKAVAIATEQNRLAPGMTSYIPGPFLATIELGTIDVAMATQWKHEKPPGGIPHLACLPQEVFDMIAAQSDDMSLAIISVTCRALRLRLPHKVHVRAADTYYHPLATAEMSDEYYKRITLPIEDIPGDHLRHISGPLEDVIVLSNGSRVKMYELLKEYMKAVEPIAAIEAMTIAKSDSTVVCPYKPKYRLYAGHYGVFVFVEVERYKELRAMYWGMYPALPLDYLEVVKRKEQAAKKALEEKENVLRAQGQRRVARGQPLALADF
ncbi:uncharacterized protein PAC_10612 [Phialocephala subalpina]|uniref:Uncharacterized protein n=1 Tax=Phialocephala subalpina TaxID=576137 RepID=A0A1L7X6R9_9HELO|nr:uncharacterized protein PAC_10612 [Phialocephala subalpina]